MIRPLLRVFALCCLLPLAGCWESPLPEGVVATVNGEAIHIRTVQAYMDGNSPGLGTRNLPPDTNQLRRDYGEALSDIIIQTLAMQDLQRRGIRGVEERARDLEEEIRDDYGPGEFDSYLAEESLDPAEWRRLLRGFVALQMLEDIVLEPELRVSRDEVLAPIATESVLLPPQARRRCNNGATPLPPTGLRPSARMFPPIARKFPFGNSPRRGIKTCRPSSPERAPARALTKTAAL